MKDEYPSRLADKMMIRLPDGMRDAIKLAAKGNRRSMNSEVVFHLERALRSANEAAGQSREELPAA